MKYLFFILISLVITKLPAQNDSIIKKIDLSFKNEQEKLAFDETNLSNSNNIISLLLISYDKENVYEKSKAINSIDACVSKLKDITNGKNEVKKVKITYDYVHKEFLKVYKLKNSFADIFSKGEYNCVSASALYALVFEKLEIPYKVIDAPQHVYLIAYPNTHKILIETTDPENGYFQFNETYINQFVKSLFNTKFISQDEYEKYSANDLFNKYYFNSSNLTIKDLISLQYSNYAVYHTDDKNYKDAINEIEKAYYINNYQRNKYILKSTLAYYIHNNKYDNQDLVSYLCIMLRFFNNKDEEFSSEIFKNEFIRLTEHQLINKSDFNLYTKSYNKLIKEIKDTALSKEISFIYNYETARVSFINDKSNSYVYSYLIEAYKINPQNNNLQSLILSNIEDDIKREDNPISIISILEDRTKNFNFLNDNSGINSVKANCLLEIAYQSFALNEISNGEKKLKEFEDLVKLKNAKPSEIFVEKAYAFAAGVYYKKGNSAKAKQTLRNGLIFAPDNFGLKIRLSQL